MVRKTYSWERNYYYYFFKQLVSEAEVSMNTKTERKRETSTQRGIRFPWFPLGGAYWSVFGRSWHRLARDKKRDGFFYFGKLGRSFNEFQWVTLLPSHPTRRCPTRPSTPLSQPLLSVIPREVKTQCYEEIRQTKLFSCCWWLSMLRAANQGKTLGVTIVKVLWRLMKFFFFFFWSYADGERKLTSLWLAGWECLHTFYFSLGVITETFLISKNQT